MVKCPNCGSTAQVKITDYDNWETEIKNKWKTVKSYSCGCGCLFRSETYCGETKIIKEN